MDHELWKGVSSSILDLVTGGFCSVPSGHTSLHKSTKETDEKRRADLGHWKMMAPWPLRLEQLSWPLPEGCLPLLTRAGLQKQKIPGFQLGRSA